MLGRVSSPVFVGRRQELAVLETTLARATQGNGGVVLIGAEAGMGKSRLLAEFGRQAEATGATMLIGECLPLGEGELPYAPVVGALRSLLRARGERVLAPHGSVDDEIVRLLPELGDGERSPSSLASDAAGARSRLLDELLAVFAGAARQAPIVLAIEDLHWSDRATRDSLTFLVRGIRRERLALVLTYRSDEVLRRHPARLFLTELERSGQAVQLELARFGRSELREQVAAILDRDPAPELIDSLLVRAEGNPFFTEELIAAARGPQQPLPESLRETLLARVEGSPERVQEVLKVVAVAGRGVEHPLLESVVDLDAGELLAAVREAVQSHLLVENPDTGAYGFRHALLREAVYDDLLLADRRALHLQLAQALSANPEPAARMAAAAELAHHWYAAGQLPQALTAAIDAARQAESVHAPGDALAHYERALELWDEVQPPAPTMSRIAVLQRAAEAAELSGQIDRAIALARETLTRVDQSDAVALSLAHERLGRYLWTAGRGEEALPEYRLAVTLMPSARTRERAVVLAADAQVLMLCNFNEISEQRCDEALQIVNDLGARDIEAHVLNTRCANCSYDGEFDAAVASAKAALVLARPLELVEEIGRAYVNGSDAFDQAGRLRESIAFAREGVEMARVGGADRQYGDFLQAEIAGRLIRTGGWDEAEMMLEQLLERAATGVISGMVFEHLAEIHAERGDRQAALQAVERAYDNVRSANGSMWLAPVAASRAIVDLWAGDPETAVRTIDACLDLFDHGEYVFFTARLHDLGIRAYADRCALALDDRATVERDTQAARDLLARLDRVIGQLAGRPQPRVLASRALCVAELSRIVGPDPSAWQTAERLAQAIDDSYQVAYIRWRRAEALIECDHDRGRDRALVEDLIRAAFGTAEALRARPLRDAVQALARAARIELETEDRVEANRGGANAAGANRGEADAGALSHDGSSGGRASGDSGLERFELTPREIEVLALLGEGMTNREIAATLVISDKTASVHVSRILAKLSVANRASAAVLAQRLGVTRTGE